MAVLQSALRFGALRAGRRLSRSLPWVGGLIAVAAVGAAIRRKGVFGGTLDTALNATPFVGAMKNAAEVLRGRDFIPDRQKTGASNAGNLVGKKQEGDAHDPEDRTG